MQKYFSFPAFIEGDNYLSLQIYQANIFEAKNDYQLDLAETKLAIVLSKKLGKKLSVQFYVPLIYAWGGFMDRFIDKFHKTFNFPDGGRGLFAYDRIIYLVGEKEFLYGNTFTGTGEPEIFLSLKGKSTNVRFGTKIPLGENGFRSFKPAIYGGTSYKTSFNHGFLKAEVGLVLISSPQELKSWFAGLNIVLRFKKVELRYIFNTSPYKSGNMSHIANAVSLGFDLGKGFTAGFVEDLAPYDTSADFTLFLTKKINL